MTGETGLLSYGIIHRYPVFVSLVLFLEFLTQPQCGLCAEALPQVESLARRYQLGLNVIDITTSDELAGEFALRVPVVRDDRGTVLGEGVIDVSKLRRVVSAARRRRRRSFWLNRDV